MNSDCIVLIASESRERGALQRILTATGVPVDVRTEERVLREGVGNARLAVVHYDPTKALTMQVVAHLSRSPSCPLVVMLPQTHKASFVELFSQAAVTNIMPETSEFLANELIVTAQKILRDDVFGLDKYLTWGMPRRDFVVANTRQSRGVIGELARYLQSLGVNNRLVQLAANVADELLMNAMYSAPVDEQGRPKYATLARNQEIALSPEETVSVSFTSDGRYLGLSVADPCGTLHTKTVRDYLRKSFVGGPNQVDSKLRGGGLGLYSVFQSLNHLVINIAPGRCTEVIGLLDISGTYRDYALQPKSFSVFVARGGPV